MAAQSDPQVRSRRPGFNTGSYPTDKPASRAARRHLPTHDTRPHPERPGKPANPGPRTTARTSPPAPATAGNPSRPPARSSGKFPANAIIPDEGGFKGQG